MRKIVILIAALAATVGSATAQEDLQPMPVPVTNNAVVGVRVQGQTLIYSFMGLGASKQWDTVKNSAYAFNLRYNKWTTIRSVQSTGRLRAFAVPVVDEVLLMGGFMPVKRGTQVIVADHSVYDPIVLRST